MKKIRTLIAILMLCSMLTGCKEDGAYPPAEPINSSSSLSSVENVPEQSESSSVSSLDDNSSNTEGEPQLSRADCEQIVSTFKAWGDLDYNIHPDNTNADNPDYFPECVDASRFITEEITRKGSNLTYTEYFYLIASGDFSTEKGFNKKLDDMFTEKFKEQYLKSSSGEMFRFKDGETYTASFGYHNETEPAISLRLTIETADENTIGISISNADEDGGQKYKATLIRQENGSFKIDDVGKDDGSMFDIPRLFHYKNAGINICRQDNVLFTL